MRALTRAPLPPPALLLAALLVAPSAAAQRRAAAPDSSRGPYVHTFGALGYGRGLRFNNPYRLQTELGSDAQSLSTTAGYVDVAAGAALGNPDGFQHGLVLHLSLAANGISQQVVSASYLLLRPLGERFLGYARAGVPFVLSPDFSAGAEAGAGAAFFLSSGLALTGEALLSVFAGAATWEHDPTWWPIASLQLGLWVDYEVLP